MTDQPTLEFNSGETDDALNLANYAQRAYLEYALSVVKGRALPDVCDGQKPVQRRILYSMDRMGLGYSGPNKAIAHDEPAAAHEGQAVGRVRDDGLHKPDMRQGVHGVGEEQADVVDGEGWRHSVSEVAALSIASTTQAGSDAPDSDVTEARKGAR